MTTDRNTIVRSEIERWREEGLLDAATAARLLGQYPSDPAEPAAHDRVAHLLGVGGVLLGLGLTALLRLHLRLEGLALVAVALGIVLALGGMGLALVRGAGGCCPDTGRALVIAGAILAWTGFPACEQAGILRDTMAFTALTIALLAGAFASGSGLVMAQAQIAASVTLAMWMYDAGALERPGPYLAMLALLGIVNMAVARQGMDWERPLVRRVAPWHHACGIVQVEVALFFLARIGWSGLEPWPERLGWSLLLLLFAGLLVRAGLRIRRMAHQVLGLCALVLEILFLYGEVLWHTLPKSITFILVGIVLILVGQSWERRLRGGAAATGADAELRAAR